MSSSSTTTIYAAPLHSSRGVRIEDSISVHVLQFVHADALGLSGCAVETKQPYLRRQTSYGSHGLRKKHALLLIILGDVTPTKRPTRLTY
jgi:hypothetical protein